MSDVNVFDAYDHQEGYIGKAVAYDDYIAEKATSVQNHNAIMALKDNKIAELRARITELEDLVNYSYKYSDVRLSRRGHEFNLEKTTVHGLDGEKCDNPVTITLEFKDE